MHLSTTRLATGVLLASVGATLAKTSYNLQVSYDKTNFFESFDFLNGEDPTHGFVDYVDQATAQQAGLIGVGQSNGSIYMGVDHTTVNPPNGRQSVRITSKDSFTRGLFIADIAHMPGSICGVWPAYWMFGPDWPSSGEIDIIEGVNTQTQNAVTLHTSSGCEMSNVGTLPSTMFESPNCGSESATSGCQQRTSSNQNYGDGFNDIKGGVYATEWTSDHIAIWFFPRSQIPQDIASGKPNPKSWSHPLARFVGGLGCHIDSHFTKNNIVFDTTFCGDWAGNPAVWGSNAECSAKSSSCKDYVSNNPADFKDAYWEVNSVKVYQQGESYGSPDQGNTSTSQPAPNPTPTSTSIRVSPTSAQRISQVTGIKYSTQYVPPSRVAPPNQVASPSQVAPTQARGTDLGSFNPAGSYVPQPWKA
ncbi:endo-1,3(4)-beta-glucanase [Purpureocillium lavendulum]|uniref:endo-1,3(4)-beta-glucanase n=1 Tax=Purpureocillium lavendulum TaxID=1247861 RepID=A0AB34G4X3_9HYPO|nr:endo-1,3(4)-beta-glucanase [Purpureocillium lavendulum]